VKSTAGYGPARRPVLGPADAAALLARVLERAGEAAPDGIVVFDLDSTILDNRPRQAEILREYGAQHGLEALARNSADDWSGWDARIAMARCGLPEPLIDEHIGPFRTFWRDRFFTSRYCVLDRSIPGAPAYVAAVLARGARVLYVTGRHEEMRPGTIECFARVGFAVPDGGAVDLLMKPALDEHDDSYKARTYDALRQRGQLVAAFDNEPTHINGYRAAFPQALSIHLATDHSPRDVPVADDIPSIADFAAASALAPPSI
jgi:phosphoglycolate phosphatase-like HAD superfamily hydrolase